MLKHSILRIDHAGKPLCIYQQDAASQNWIKTNVSDWSDDRLSQHEWLILVPATWVYHSRTEVASKNLELLAKSIPFAIEEELSNDVESNYFAFKLNQDGSQDVIAIEKAHLNELNRQISQQSLRVASIHSEVDWLPSLEGAVTIWSDSNSSLIRFGTAQAMRVSNPQIKQLLPVFAQDLQTIICNDTELLGQQQLPAKQQLSVAVCCDHLLQHPAIDLYVDELKTQDVVDQPNPWRKVKWMASLLVISWVMIQMYQWYSLQAAIDDIKQQQQNILVENFPNAAAAELVDPFAALQSRLQLQSAQSAQGNNVLIDAIDKLGQTVQQQKQVKLTGLRLVDQKVELQIVAPTMTVINDFHQLLQQYAIDYMVQIGVNELGDDNTFKSIISMVRR